MYHQIRTGEIQRTILGNNRTEKTKFRKLSKCWAISMKILPQIILLLFFIALWELRIKCSKPLTIPFGT